MRYTRKEILNRSYDAFWAIVDELKKRGHVVDATFDDGSGEPAHLRARTVMRLGEARVPVTFEQHVETSGVRMGPTAEVKLVINEMMLDITHRVPRRTFRASKKHQGYNVPAICDHIERWASAYDQARETGRALRESVARWNGTLAALRAKYPRSASRLDDSSCLSLTASPDGIDVHGTVGERVAEAIFRALRPLEGDNLDEESPP